MNWELISEPAADASANKVGDNDADQHRGESQLPLAEVSERVTDQVEGR